MMDEMNEEMKDENHKDMLIQYLMKYIMCEQKEDMKEHDKMPASPYMMKEKTDKKEE